MKPEATKETLSNKEKGCQKSCAEKCETKCDKGPTSVAVKISPIEFSALNRMADVAISTLSISGGGIQLYEQIKPFMERVATAAEKAGLIKKQENGGETK